MIDKILTAEKFSLEDSEIITMGPIDNLLKLSPISEMLMKKEVGCNKLPSRYIINKNATILFWEDGSKTVVKRCEDCGNARVFYVWSDGILDYSRVDSARGVRPVIKIKRERL